MVLMSKNLKNKKEPIVWGGQVKTESFVLIAIASFAIGFVTSLLAWFFTVDYIFVVLK